MIYLITKVVVWLGLAFVLGALLGWWLRRFKANEAQAEYFAQLETLTQQNTTLEQVKGSLARDLAASAQSLSEAEDSLGAKEQELLTQTNESLKLQRQLSEAQVRIAEQEEETTQLSGQLELHKNSLAELQEKSVKMTQDHDQSLSEWTLQRSTLEDKLSIADNDLVALTASSSKREQQYLADGQRTESENQVALNELQVKLDQAQAGADQGAKTLQAKVDGLQQQHVKLQQQHTEQLELAGSLDKSNARLSTKVANLLEELANVKAATEQQEQDGRTKLEALEQEAVQARELAEERQRELDANNDSLSNNELQVQRLTQDVRRWRQRIPDLQGELDERDALLRERDGRLATLQEQLQRSALRAQSSQQALIGRGSNLLPQQQKDARIAQLMAQVERLQAAAAQPPAIATKPFAALTVVPTQPPQETQAPQETQESQEIKAEVATASVDGALSDPASPAKPQGFYTSRPAQVDDLQRIKGIGPKLEGLLHELGVFQFQQIAEFSRSDVAWLDDYLNFKGRIDRDSWIAQAQSFVQTG